NAFNGSLEEIVSSLTGNGAKGVIANIPNVLEYPYFNTIPYNGLNLDAATASVLNSIGLGVNFVEGSNPFTMEDSSSPSGLRQLLPGELVLLNVPLDSVKCNAYGSAIPFRDEFVLTLDEIDEIKTKIDQYNNVIQSIAQTYGLAIADVRLLVSQLKSGAVYNGVSSSATFVTGGAYSLDGLQLNPIGQALLANQFIKAINTTYNANIPEAVVTKYSGVIFP